jgi:hypothetical protein
MGRAAAFFLLQASVWIGLAVAFAILIQMAGWTTWREALAVSAPSWLPWILVAPAVYWLAQRFPFERGRLLSSIPIHLAACAATCAGLLWVSIELAPPPRPPMGGRPPFDRSRTDWAERSAAERIQRERIRSESAPVMRPPAERGWSEPADAAAARTSGERPRSDSYERGARSGAFDRMGRGGGPEGGLYRGGPRGPGDFRRTGFFARLWPPFGTTLLRLNFSVAIYLIVACAAHALAYYRRAQQRESEAIALAAGLNRAKLEALRLQLQPHFLFNTLNAISTLVHRDPRAADELIGDLSELLRLSLQTSENEVPLSRELELLDCYLAIEKIRLGERLRIVREIDPAALPVLVPTFVLQPLAENAIRHGIEPRREPGTLTLTARTEGDRLHIAVSDDGVGLKPAEPRAARRGIGLANTEERLRALHGGTAQLELTSPESGGVRVELTLPAKTAATPAAVSAPSPA